MTNLTMLCRDRYRLTRQTLDSLAASRNEQELHVTVLDDRSQLATRTLLEEWCFHHDATYVRNDRAMGTGQLRNMVIDYTVDRGEYLCISDNDLFYLPQWLDVLIACYEQVWSNGFRVLGAYNHPFHQPVWSVRTTGMTGGMLVNETHALASQSMLMRWEVFDKYGPFCSTPVDHVCQSEDVDFTNRIKADHFRIGVVYPWLAVNTGITNSFGEHIPGWETVKRQALQGVIVE